MPAFVSFGYFNAACGQLLELSSWTSQFPTIDSTTASPSSKTHVSILQGTVVATYNLGALFGSLSCIPLGDRLGRIRTMTLGAVISMIGIIIQSSSFSLAQLIVGRVIMGLGLGMVAATVPTWTSECSTAEHRGSIVILESVFISAGICLAGWLVLGLSFVEENPVAWRFPLALQALLIGTLAVSAPWWPESPRWLLRHKREQEVREVVSALRDLPLESEELNAEIAEMQGSVELLARGRFKDLLQNGEQRLLHRTILAVIVGSFQQLCGINALAPYASLILSDYLGLDATDSRIVAACLFTFQTICSPAGVFTVDRIGRRKLLMFGAIGMGGSCAIVAGLVSQTQNNAALEAAIAFIFIFFGCFPIGALGITFLYGSETAPLNARVPITALSVTGLWATNFLVAEVSPLGFANIHYRYFIVWACVNLLGFLPAFYFFFPETKGRHLEQIDEIFINSRTIFDPVKVEKTIPKRTIMEQVLHEDTEKQNAEQVEHIE
ncbi:MAG: hypothetical protein M1820_001397 [Bogoriella megaspora]|nr:MAG: hypothetical protein M1820_001397 [Bogoriella megaspora]